MELLGYGISILMGMTLGMIGGGGSILTVPLLVYIFGLQPLVATAYSLFIVGSTALIGGIFSYRKGEVDLRTGLVFAIPSFIGVYTTRAFVIPSLPDPILSISTFTITKSLLMMLVFAILMLAASYSMIRSKSNLAKASALSPQLRYLLIAFEGFIVGGVTGFVGAGGGFLIIPALVVLVGLPMKIAVGTSLFIIAAKSLFGFLGDLQSGTMMNWSLLLNVTALAIVGIFIGMALASKIADAKLKKAFGYFVLIMGSGILIDQIIKLST